MDSFRLWPFRCALLLDVPPAPSFAELEVVIFIGSVSCHLPCADCGPPSAWLVSFPTNPRLRYDGHRVAVVTTVRARMNLFVGVILQMSLHQFQHSLWEMRGLSVRVLLCCYRVFDEIRTPIIDRFRNTFSFVKKKPNGNCCHNFCSKFHSSEFKYIFNQGTNSILTCTIFSTSFSLILCT